MLAAGYTLGAFLGGLGVAVLLTAPLVAAHERPLARLLAAAGVIDGIGLVWLWLWLTGPITFGQWLQCYLVLAAFAAVLAAMTMLLLQAKVTAAPAAALVTFVGIAWLTWPIWMAPYLSDSPGLVPALVWPHPLFGINGILLQTFGPWAERGIAYRLTNIGDDIPYAMPGTLVPATAVHLAFAAVLAAPILLRRRQFANAPDRADNPRP